jgi:di/tricarboxylate transporter
MIFPASIVLIVLAFLVISLYYDLLKPVLVFFISALFFLITGVIDSKDLMSGFANEQIAVVLLLLLLSDIIRKTPVIDVAFNGMFRQEMSYRGFLAKMSATVSLVSGFVNNTPLVAIILPYVYDWARRKNISPSKVLIPLSYATILGGTITLVGTSTNLVVNGFATEAGLPSLGMFDFTPIGIPVAIVGVLYIIFIAPRLLPDRQDALKNFREKSREYVVETQVPRNSRLIGKTVEQAGLRKLEGLFLVEMIQGEERITPVSPKQRIEEGDILIFAGATSTIIDLLKSGSGLELPKYTHLPGQEMVEIVETVISYNSGLVGKIVKDTNFRGKYDAAIVAVNRNGERITGKIGEVELQTGDLLLLVTGKDFSSRAEEEQDFHVISQLRQIHNIAGWKVGVLFGGTASVFLLSALGILSLFVGLLILMSVIASIRLVKFTELKKSFDMDLFLILVLSLSLGKAITKSGLDDFFATNILDAVAPLGSNLAILAVIYFLTNVLAMLVTNKAAVAIMFPVALAASKSIGADPTPFVLAIAFAGSAEFMTPYGYQTNLMIYGPGGYKFKDYVKVGWGLSLIYMIVCVSILGYIYNFY